MAIEPTRRPISATHQNRQKHVCSRLEVDLGTETENEPRNPTQSRDNMKERIQIERKMKDRKKGKRP